MSGNALDHLALGQVVDCLEVGIIILDGEARIRHCNRWLLRHSGRDATDLIGLALPEAFPEIAGPRLAQAVEHAIRNRLPSLLSPALHGTLLPLYQTAEERCRERRMQQLIHVLPLRDDTGQTACLIQISDVTANISRERLLRQQTETLRRTTTQDALTGIANRRKFDETLAGEFHKAQRSHKPLALLIVDLDLFADYNTHYGREQGDACLRDIATAIADTVRPVGDLVARYGGDEFALILPGLDDKETALFADNLRLRIQTLDIAHPTAGNRLTVSVGATSMRPDNEADTHTLLSSADVALYQAKHEGRNRAILFSPEDGSFRHCN
jgi:diguanylate cyclase (GGDEF)-like protein